MNKNGVQSKLPVKAGVEKVRNEKLRLYIFLKEIPYNQFLTEEGHILIKLSRNNKMGNSLRFKMRISQKLFHLFLKNKLTVSKSNVFLIHNKNNTFSIRLQVVVSEKDFDFIEGKRQITLHKDKEISYEIVYTCTDEYLNTVKSKPYIKPIKKKKRKEKESCSRCNYYQNNFCVLLQQKKNPNEKCAKYTPNKIMVYRGGGVSPR